MAFETNVIHVLVARELKKFLREKSRFISSLARPLIWLFMIGSGMGRLVQPGSGVSYTQYIFPGILGMTVLFSSIFSSISIIWDKEFGFMKEILVAPVRRSSIVVGKALSGTVVSTVQALVVLALFPLVGVELGFWQVVEVVLLCALISFCVSSFGIVLATFQDSYESFSVIMNFIIMPMFFLSGAMYPVRLLPPALQWVSRVNPFTYGVDGLKNIINPMGGTSPMSPDFPLALDVLVVMVLSIVFVAAASWKFERGD